MAPALAAIPGLLAIVALLIDFATLAIGHVVDARALLRRHHTVGAGASLRTIDRPLALLKAIGLAPGDLAVANAALDAVLLLAGNTDGDVQAPPGRVPTSLLLMSRP
jgi:hypothetical protein